MENEYEYKPKKAQVESNEIEIVPLKDHVIHHNEFHYELKAGVKISINKKFLEVLKTEKVLKGNL